MNLEPETHRCGLQNPNRRTVKELRGIRDDEQSMMTDARRGIVRTREQEGVRSGDDKVTSRIWKAWVYAIAGPSGKQETQIRNTTQ